MKYYYHLVVRVSMLDGVDPIDEVDRVLTKMGFCWFAKYGQPIHGPLLYRLEEEADVALTLVYKNVNGYKLASYHIEEISSSPKLETGTFPPYYVKFLNRVGSFIKITELRGPQPGTDDLEVRSSLNTLTKALRTSMRGYFICRPKLRS